MIALFTQLAMGRFEQNDRFPIQIGVFRDGREPRDYHLFLCQILLDRSVQIEPRINALFILLAIAKRHSTRPFTASIRFCSRSFRILFTR